MKELVIGADGFIGAALARVLGCAGTSRRGGGIAFDMLDFKDVPEADTVYVCAGANGAKRCEGVQESFRVNVDAPVEIARIVGARGGFTVCVTSMSVEWLDGAYQRQKLAAESMLRVMPSVGIVRAGRVTKENVGELCVAIASVGRLKRTGVTRWGSDDISYTK